MNGVSRRADHEINQSSIKHGSQLRSRSVGTYPERKPSKEHKGNAPPKGRHRCTIFSTVPLTSPSKKLTRSQDVISEITKHKRYVEPDL